jgi:hypothetical protein
MNLPTAIARRLRRSEADGAASRLHAVLGRAIEAVAVTASWLLLPALPFVASAIARDWSYVRRYPGTLTRIHRHILASWRSDAVSRAWALHFDPLARVDGNRITGSCTHCGNCCLHKQCVFLGFEHGERSFCRIYGGRVWRLLPCGAYPTSKMDIDLYACPSFRAVRNPDAGPARVIPIHPVFSGSRHDTD